MNIEDINRDRKFGVMTPKDSFVSLVRKAAFLELNKYLKDNNCIVRYKKNMDFLEIGNSSYSKIVGDMVRDLIIYRLGRSVNLDQIEISKSRGMESFYVTFTAPQTGPAVEELVGNLVTLSNSGCITYDTWGIYRGARANITILYNRLPIVLPFSYQAGRGRNRYNYVEKTKNLASFIEIIDAVARLLAPLHPIVNPVEITPPEPVVTEIITEQPNGELLIATPNYVEIGLAVAANTFAIEIVRPTDITGEATLQTVNVDNIDQPLEMPTPLPRRAPIVLRRIDREDIID